MPFVIYLQIKAFTGEEIKIFSYKDENVLKDLPSWKGLPIQLFRAGPMLYSKEVKKNYYKKLLIFFTWKPYGVILIY